MATIENGVSVIIPTLNESQELPATLDSVTSTPIRHEVIVVDGGSTDHTARVAQTFSAKLVHCPTCQRAQQMNKGAMKARFPILFFLHADTLLPPNGLFEILQTMQRPTLLGGAFARRFKHPSKLLSLTTRLADYRAKYLHCALGDQALFVRRAVFAEMNGFKLWKQFEDLDFSIRLHQLGPTTLIQSPVITSARRFEKHGPLKQTLFDLAQTFRFLQHYQP